MRVENNFFRRMLGKIRETPIDWDLRPYLKRLPGIARFELERLPDRELTRRSGILRERVQTGEPADGLLEEAASLVREAARRTIGLRPYDVQVVAGLALHEGRVVEMSTGEGKTLAAVLPAYLGGLTGRGVHVLTFNDYLARRDAAWMGPVYRMLGLSPGCIQQGMAPDARRRAYHADVTYATAKEAGFDFLRDRLCFSESEQVHREFHFAVIDEADSILIDEARVPLVIAGSTETATAGPPYLAELVRDLVEGEDFETDDGRRNIALTESGAVRVEEMLGCGRLHDPENLDLLTRLNLALHARYLLHQDVDYIVRTGRIEIVDEFTGRVVDDRHWPDGLQAAVEAKEGLRRGAGGTVLGSITLQHFLGLYPRLSGMTATARPAADEFSTFYGLKTVPIPSHRPCIREDEPDLIFSHRDAKNRALIEEIRESYAARRPVLVGTASVGESEELAATLAREDVPCRVLNAKNDEREAAIIAEAGAPGAVTISTNMAGRGTDIKLGGADEEARDKVMGLGGLYVIGTNRHESLRIDRQLRGRAGRQGDPGTSRFFISLEDPLFVRFGLRRRLPRTLRETHREGPIEHPRVHREVEWGQRIIESQNFGIRKTLWKYSQICERQRAIVQGRRQEILRDGEVSSFLAQAAAGRYGEWRTRLGKDRLREIERRIALFHLDRVWADHLAWITDTRESIHLIAAGGRSPLNEFHRMATTAFLELDGRIDEDILTTFESLVLENGGVDLDKAGLRGPSSTWTYLVNDNQFEEMLKTQNIGFHAVAIATWGPIWLIPKLIERFKSKPR